MTGKIAYADIGFLTGKPMLTLAINERQEFEALVNELKDKDKLSIEIKPQPT